jgi:chromosome segregation ATPase
MCKALNKRGKTCNLQPTKELCHIHKASAELAKLAEFKTNATRTIETLSQDNNRLSATSDLLDREASRLSSELKQTTKHCVLLRSKIEGSKPSSYHTEYKKAAEHKIQQLEREVTRLTERLTEVTKLNNHMRPDYERYQIIKSFEHLNQQLESVDFHRRGSLYHDLRLTRNLVAHPALV